MPIKTQQDEQPSLNLTPMIDVVFLLIIFFMVATKFNEMERNIELNVPQIRHAGTATSPPKKRSVHVHRDGHIELDGTVVTLDQLFETLSSAKKLNAATGVTIRCDEGCAYQDFAEALGACKESGITNMHIAVRAGEGRKTR